MREKRVSAPTTLISEQPPFPEDSSFNLRLKHSAGGILSFSIFTTLRDHDYKSTTLQARTCRPEHHSTRASKLRLPRKPICSQLQKAKTPGLACCVEHSRPRAAWMLWRPPQGSRGPEVSQVQASSRIFSDTTWAQASVR